MTDEAFWREVHGDAACWRTATRRTHWCSNQSLSDDHPARCPHREDSPAISVGDRYFDTGEVVGQWRTAKLCAACAARPVVTS